jgi:hypothetical protein
MLIWDRKFRILAVSAAASDSPSALARIAGSFHKSLMLFNGEFGWDVPVQFDNWCTTASPFFLTLPLHRLGRWEEVTSQGPSSVWHHERSARAVWVANHGRSYAFRAWAWLNKGCSPSFFLFMFLFLFIFLKFEQFRI